MGSQQHQKGKVVAPMQKGNNTNRRMQQHQCEKVTTPT